MVSTHLKKISQIGSCPQGSGGENKKIFETTSQLHIWYHCFKIRKPAVFSQGHKAGIVSQHSQGQLPQAFNALTAQGSCRRNASIVFAFQGPSKPAGICWQHYWQNLWVGNRENTRLMYLDKTIATWSFCVSCWSTVNQEQFRNWNPSHWDQLTKGMTPQVIQCFIYRIFPIFLPFSPIVSAWSW